MSLKIQLKRKTNFKSILRNDSKILRRNPTRFSTYIIEIPNTNPIEEWEFLQNDSKTANDPFVTLKMQ